MTVVFDTMLFAYSGLGVPGFGEESERAIHRGLRDAIWAPDVLRAELANAVWKMIRTGRASLDIGLATLHDANAQLERLVPADELWEHAVELSLARDHPVYDTLFVALAAAEGVTLVTYDRRVLARFPEYAISVGDYLAS